MNAGIHVSRLLATILAVLTPASGALAAKPAAAPLVGGHFRVVNTGARANVYHFTIRFHQAPWRTRDDVTFQAGVVQPGGATEWVHLPRHVKLRPVTLQVMTRRLTGGRLRALGGEQESNIGRVEFAAAITGAKADAAPAGLLRAIDMNGRTVTVELDLPGFTSADQIRQDVEIGAATLALVRTFQFKGKSPARFPTGWAGGTLDEYRAGRVLGFTAVSAASPAGLPGRGARLFDELGYLYIYSHTQWLGMWNQGGGGYRREQNSMEMRKAADQWRAAGLLDRVYRVSLRDEAELYDLRQKTAEALKTMHKDPPVWAEIMRWAGLTPADFMHPDSPPPAGAAPDSPEYWQALRGAGPDMRDADPQRVYNTMQTWQATWSARFGNVREALHEAFGRPVMCTANIHFETYFRDRGGFDPWNEYSKLRTLDIPQVCDYGVGWPQQAEWLIDLQRCAARPHNAPVDAMLQAQQRYMPRPPMHLKLCALSALGAGARSLSFYRWGPRYLDTENWFDTDPARLRVIGEVNHAAGWVEDILLDGAPRQARIAMMVSRPDAMWNMLTPAKDQPSPGMYSRSLRTTYHLLRGLHRQVDFINDTVPPRAQGVDIDRYRVIFIMQRCMPAEAAAELLAWVERGGTLVGVLSIGQFDHLERPAPVMPNAFGLKSLEVVKAPGEEPPAIPSAGITLRAPGAPVARIQVGEAEVVHRFEDGAPAVTRHRLGRGELIYVAFEPGGAYHRMQGEATGPARELRLLTGMQASVRDLAAQWVRPAGEPFCQTDDPLVGARLIESPSGSAVFLINATGRESLDRVEVRLRETTGSRVTSLERGPVEAQREGDTLVFALPLDMTDVIRIE